jgi:hypothetical protein
MEEIFILTDRILASLLDNIRGHLGAVYKIAESLAFVDMMTRYVLLLARLLMNC